MQIDSVPPHAGRVGAVGGVPHLYSPPAPASGVSPKADGLVEGLHRLERWPAVLLVP